MKRCLLVIDMLNDFMAPDGALYCGDAARKIIPRVQKEMLSVRRGRGQIIFICDAHAADDPEFQRFPPHAVKGSRGAEIIPELPVKPGDLRIEKAQLSCFHRTSLARTLRRLKPREVRVTGVCTSICVMSAVTDLITRGYEVVVPRAAVADFDPDAHAFALKHMAKVWGAKVE